MSLASLAPMLRCRTSGPCLWATEGFWWEGASWCWRLPWHWAEAEPCCLCSPHLVFTGPLVPVALRHDTACVLPALNASIQKLWRQDPCAGQSTVSLHGPGPGPGLPQPSANPVASPGPATLCPSIRPTDPSLWHHLASTHLCDSHQGMTATALAPPPWHETCHSQPQEWPWCHAHPVHLSALQCSLSPLRPC